MSKKLFSVVLLVSLVASSVTVFGSAAPKPAASTEVKRSAEATSATAATADCGSCTTHAKPSVVSRAASAVKSAASSSVNAVKSVATGSANVVKSVVTRSAAATTAVVASVYNLAWVNNKKVTCAAIAALTGVLLYTYNDTVRTKIRSFFGLDEETCRFCPKTDEGCQATNC